MSNHHDKGTGHFIRQRITALINLPLIGFLIWTLVSLNGASHAEVLAALSSPLTAILMGLTLLSVTYHMMLGVQVILEDYVHGKALLSLSLLLNRAFSGLILVTGLYALLKIAAGW